MASNLGILISKQKTFKLHILSVPGILLPSPF